MYTALLLLGFELRKDSNQFKAHDDVASITRAVVPLSAVIDRSKCAFPLTNVAVVAQGDIIKCIDGRKVKEWSVEKCYHRLQGATCESDALHACDVCLPNRHCLAVHVQC